MRKFTPAAESTREFLPIVSLSVFLSGNAHIMLDLNHNRHDALELEFYIPVAVWDHPATGDFLSGVYSLVEGATIVGGAKGVWRGETETTNLVRIVLRETDLNVDEVLTALQVAVNRLMRAWASSSKNRQESFMFTARPLTVFESVFGK